MLITSAFLFVAAFAAFALSAICGGGAGLILIPILGIYLPISSVPAALSLGTASSSLSRIITFYKNIRWDIVKTFVPASIPAVWLGSWLLQFLNPLYLQLIMGVFLISNITQIFKKSKEGSSTQSKLYLSMIGFLVGFLSGMTGAVGLLFNKFYLRYGLNKEEIIATRAANEIILHIIKLVLYTFFGLMTVKVLLLGLSIALAAFVSSYSMKFILPRLSYNLFKKVGYSAMVLSGISLLGDSSNKLFAQNRGDIDFYPISKGIESKVKWADSNFSIEFVYNEGFEYEQVIGLKDLPEEKQKFVLNEARGFDRMLIEEVYGLNEHSYELYLLKNNKAKQIDF